jgi:hypothetical protein
MGYYPGNKCQSFVGCTKLGRMDRLGEIRGFCMDCAKTEQLLERGDHDPMEPAEFTEFWELVAAEDWLEEGA